MRKKFLIVVVVVIAIAAAGLWVFFGGRTAATLSGPEEALPSVAEGEEYIFVKLANPGRISSMLSGAGETITKIAEDEKISDLLTRSVDISDIPMVVDSIGRITGFFDDTEEIAALVKSPDSAIYLSFLMNDKNFDNFISPKTDSLKIVEEWKTEAGDGWKFTLSGPSGLGGAADFYMLKRPAGGANLVMISNSEEKIGDMTAAADNPSRRFALVRRTAGENFILGKLPLGDVGFVTPKNPFYIELSWTDVENRTELQVYTDIYEDLKQNATKRAVKGGDFPILGNGKLALFAMVDVPYACFSLFPDKTDPVRAFLDSLNEFTPEGWGLVNAMRGDIEALMERGRLSLAIVVNDNKPSLTYLIIESGATETIDKFFAMASMFVNKPVSIEGWDRAYTASMGPNMSPVLARKDGAILVGVGDGESFGRRAQIPDGMNTAGAEGLSDIFISSEIIGAIESYRTIMGKNMRERLSGDGIPSFVFDMIDKVDSIRLKTSEPGKSEMTIFWKDLN